VVQCGFGVTPYRMRFLRFFFRVWLLLARNLTIKLSDSRVGLKPYAFCMFIGRQKVSREWKAEKKEKR